MKHLLKMIAGMFLVSFILSSSSYAQPKYELTAVDEAQIKTNIANIKTNLNSVLPEKYQSLALANSINKFLTLYEDYLKKYFTISGKLPDLIGPDAIGEIDKILAEENGFTTKDIAEELFNADGDKTVSSAKQSLIGIIENEIRPQLMVDYEKYAINKQKQDKSNAEKWNWEKWDSKSQEGLSKRLEGILEKLAGYEANLRDIREKLIKEEGKFSKTAKSYMDTKDMEGNRFNITMPDLNKPQDLSGVVDYGKVFSQRLRKLYLMDEIGTMALLEKERIFTETGIDDVKTAINNITELKRIADENKFTKSEIQSGHDAADFVEAMSKVKYENIGKGPALHQTLGAQAGGMMNMYFALVLRDVFHALTGGQFLSETDRSDYIKYKYEGTGKRLEHLFKRYGKWETHVSLMSFAFTSYQVATRLPTTKVMENLFKWSDRALYGIGGRTLIRGISIYGLSMGLGAKVGEIVGTGLMLRSEFLSGNQEIRDKAWDLFVTENFSPQAWEELSRFVVAFGLADVIWDGRTLPRFYNKMKRLNKKKCAYAYDEMVNDAQDRKLADQTQKAWYHPKSLGKSTAIFITADFIDNYFLSLFMFPNAKAQQEKLMEAKYVALYMAEVNALTEEILVTKPTDKELEMIYDGYHSKLFLTDIIDALRKENAAVKTCLGFRDDDKDLGAIECLETLYATKSSSSPQFIAVVNKYIKDSKDKLALIEGSTNYINSDEHKQDVYDRAVSFLADTKTHAKLESTKKLTEVVTPQMIADGIITKENMDQKEAVMLESIKQGNLDKALNSTKELLDLYFESELYSLFSSVITDAMGASSVGVEKPIITLSEKYTKAGILPSKEANQYLQKMIYLFSSLYPKVMGAVVNNSKGIPIAENKLRAKILTALATNEYDKLKLYCSVNDLEKANKLLDDLRKEILFTESKAITSLYLTTMTDSYVELGLKKKFDPSAFNKYKQVSSDTNSNVVPNVNVDTNGNKK